MNISVRCGKYYGTFFDNFGVSDTSLAKVVNQAKLSKDVREINLDKGYFIFKEEMKVPANYVLSGKGSGLFDGTKLLGDDARLILNDGVIMKDFFLTGVFEIVENGKVTYENVKDMRSGNIKKVDNPDIIKVNGNLIPLITPHPITINNCDECPFCDEDHMHCKLAPYYGEPMSSANSYEKIPIKCPLFKLTGVEVALTKEARDKIKYEMEHLRK